MSYNIKMYNMSKYRLLTREEMYALQSTSVFEQMMRNKFVISTESMQEWGRHRKRIVNTIQESNSKGLIGIIFDDGLIYLYFELTEDASLIKLKLNEEEENDTE